KKVRNPLFENHPKQFRIRGAEEEEDPQAEIQESDEARKKFSNAKSLSSSQYFGDQNKATDVAAQATLSKFSLCIFFINELL
ncbi:hypothetical protein HN51_028209, partial [Arachis hypogaea]